MSNRLTILGCGWLGSRLATYFASHYSLYLTTTTLEKQQKLSALGYEAVQLKFGEGQVFSKKEMPLADNVIITIPFSKRDSLEHLKFRFTQLLSFLKGHKGGVFLCSSIGIYPSLAEEITEENVPNAMLHSTLFRIEELVQSAFPQTVVLRLGGLMGDDRVFHHYYRGQPNQVANHIHYHDICRAIHVLLQRQVKTKTYNLVAPIHPRKGEIVAHQRGGLIELATPYGKQVSGKAIQREQGFVYQYENPVYF